MKDIRRAPEIGGLAHNLYQTSVAEIARKFVAEDEDCIIFLGAGAGLTLTRSTFQPPSSWPRPWRRSAI